MKKKRNDFYKIYEIVSKIPKGKVATYGQIGKNLKISPRIVGFALHHNPDPKKIPCHRVVNREGKLAQNYAFGGVKEQKRKLIKDGVKFFRGKVLDKYFASI